MPSTGLKDRPMIDPLSNERLQELVADDVMRADASMDVNCTYGEFRAMAKELLAKRGHVDELRAALEAIGKTNIAGYVLNGRETHSEMTALVVSFYQEFRKRVDIADRALSLSTEGKPR